MGSYPCFDKTRETGRHAVKKLPYLPKPDAPNKTDIVKQIAMQDEQYQSAPVFHLTMADIISRRKPKKKGNA